MGGISAYEATNREREENRKAGRVVVMELEAKTVGGGVAHVNVTKAEATERKPKAETEGANMVDFWNAEEFADYAGNASLFWGVVEYDKFEGQYMPVAAFMYENYARDYAAFLEAKGSRVAVVDLVEAQGLR